MIWLVKLFQKKSIKIEDLENPLTVTFLGVNTIINLKSVGESVDLHFNFGSLA